MDDQRKTVEYVCFATFMNWWLRPIEAPQMAAFGHTIETQGDLILWILVANSCKMRANTYEPEGRERAAVVKTKSGRKVQKIASVKLNELVELESMHELVGALRNMVQDGEDILNPICFVIGALHAYIDALDYETSPQGDEYEEQRKLYTAIYKHNMEMAEEKQALIEAALKGEQHIGKRAEMADRVEQKTIMDFPQDEEDDVCDCDDCQKLRAEQVTDSPEEIVAAALRKMTGNSKH